MELGSLSLERHGLPDAHNVTKARGITNGVLTSTKSVGLHGAEAPAQYGENHGPDKWRFTYHDELIFFFGYCMCLPEHYQDYVGPP
ncbi:hypothetical protein [Mucilaginibacter pedocola]|uniref:Uncharacterized protein n=1 Tax=Mucilaginibacter pedocola TaxID=1792845 RepID=A0A1S9PCV4_9SPHI|nr:hypothetical protein [Mucilaginibacter pedocola]OOQ58428.1 hypothetical protein BC343_07035 [Mucilaginibacter pedocola]